MSFEFAHNFLNIVLLSVVLATSCVISTDGGDIGSNNTEVIIFVNWFSNSVWYEDSEYLNYVQNLTGLLIWIELKNNLLNLKRQVELLVY